MSRAAGSDTSLFRLVVVITLVLIFITVATLKIWELRIAAERVGVMHILGSLRSAIGIKAGELIIRDGVQSLASLQQSNPMQLWSPPPPNYFGEFPSDRAPLEAGIWYFDQDAKMLIYRVRFGDYFSSSNPDFPGLARYQLRLAYLDRNHNQRYDASLDEIKGLALTPVDTYSWLIEN